MVLLVVLIGVVGFGAIQLIPIQRTNPPVASEPNWDSPATRTLAARACFDCHSNETRWPWYSYVAPVSWLIAHDVSDGRRQLNFSDWSRARGAEQVTRVIESGQMPPFYYGMMHPDAVLSAQDKQNLIAGLQRTLSQS